VLLPALGIAILVGLGVMVGLTLLIVPGIILFLRWCVAVPVLVQERQGVLASMGRSAALTQGNRWALFGLFLIVVIILIVAQFIVGLVVALFGGMLAATFLAIFFVPLFFVLVRKLSRRGAGQASLRPGTHSIPLVTEGGK